MENKLPSVFFSYSHADEALRDQLEKQLAMLKRQGVIETWHDRRIGAGEEFGKAIDHHVENDDIILLLASPDFLASDYCYELEMSKALIRHEQGDAVVIPVILRACDWKNAPFGKLNATPKDGKAITSLPNIDEAFLEVANAIRQAATHFTKKTFVEEKENLAAFASIETSDVFITAGPRSSNLRVAKSFTQRDKDKFRLETFEFMARFFENSLAEFGQRNPGFEGVFRRVDANRFFATVYKSGNDVARCTIFLSTSFSVGICYAAAQITTDNTMNDILHVENDDQSLFLSSGMSAFGRNRDAKFSQEGASELYWGNLIEPLQ